MSIDCEGGGRVCDHAGCFEFDFLPVRCAACANTFCQRHWCPEDHECPSASRSEDPPLLCSSSQFATCSHCGIVDIFVTVCSVCSKAACVAHRFEHLHDDAARTRTSITSSKQPSFAVKLGPLPLGSDGRGCLALVLSAAGGGVVVPAVVGLGGSVGRLCDDMKSWVTAMHPLLLNATGRASRDDSNAVSVLLGVGFRAGVVESNPSLNLRVRLLDNNIVAQDLFPASASVTEATSPMALVFWIGKTEGATCDSVTDDFIRFCNENVKVHAKLTLLARIRHREPKSRTIGIEGESTHVGAPPANEVNGVASTVDDAAAPVGTKDWLSTKRPFSTTKAKPIIIPSGGDLKKFRAALFVAVYVGCSADVPPPFVIALDSAVSCGKLLDQLVTHLRIAPSSAALVLLKLPEQKWIASTISGGTSVMMNLSPCRDVLDNGAAIGLIRVPLETPMHTRFLSIEKECAALDPKWLKQVRLMQCMIM